MSNNPFSNPDTIGQTDWIEDLSSKEMLWDYCPSCAGELDTGFECNSCGRDWRLYATVDIYQPTTESES